MAGLISDHCPDERLAISSKVSGWAGGAKRKAYRTNPSQRSANPNFLNILMLEVKTVMLA